MRPSPFVFATVLSSLIWLPPSGAQEGPSKRVVAPEGGGIEGLPFSPGIESGDFLYLSGALGLAPGASTVDGPAEAQARQTLANLEAVLKAAGLDWTRVVEFTVYVTDFAYYDAVAKAIGDVLEAPLPARTVVETDLALPGAVVEIAAVAARRGVAIEPVAADGWPETASRYSWAISAGDALFLSGMGSIAPPASLQLGTIGEQTTRSLSNLAALLAAADRSPEDLAWCRVYLADARDYPAMNEAYAAFFASAVPPARATVRARSIHPQMKIQLQCLAVTGGERRVVAAAGQTSGGRPFSPAIAVGDELFVSGMVGRGADGYPAGVGAQTEVVMQRIGATLAAAGMSFGDVREATVYLSDVRYFAAMNEVYRRSFPAAPPARATVGTQLASPDALVEIQVSAAKARGE